MPLIQPATKALAQMLAGRTNASGQLGHARAVLAQTERLVSDRAHNRLNPAEREEFFEQVARLKLTLADAESEAEVEAMEEEAPAPAPTTVDRERLREMAMSLTSPGGPTSYENRHRLDAGPSGDELEQDADDDDADDDEQMPAPPATKPADDPNQLRLPRAGSAQLTIQPEAARMRANGRRRITAKAEGTADRAKILKVSPKAEASTAPATKASKSETSEGTAAAAKTTAPAKAQKLPKGWIIDDEGFVVPGPAG
ncbi:MAG: hypothetical protein R3F54_10965 [Alphaproteobacteria bacterium]